MSQSVKAMMRTQDQTQTVPQLSNFTDTKGVGTGTKWQQWEIQGKGPVTQGGCSGREERELSPGMASNTVFRKKTCLLGN